jgi:hypothetical protein
VAEHTRGIWLTNQEHKTHAAAAPCAQNVCRLDFHFHFYFNPVFGVLWELMLFVLAERVEPVFFVVG